MGAFSCNTVSNVLILFYQVTEMTVTVQAIDSGTPARNSTTTLVVSVVNDADHLPPSWNQIDGEDIDDIQVSLKLS